MIALRDVRQSDERLLFEWRTRPEVAQYMYTDHEISATEHGEWFWAAQRDSSRRYWVIACDDVDVGLASLSDLDMANRRCSWTFYIADESARGKGVGGVTEFLVLSHVFESLGMNRLACTVLATNTRVIDMHLGFGFREEGRMREYILRDGQPIDVVLLSMLREDWLTARDGIVSRLVRRGLI